MVAGMSRLDGKVAIVTGGSRGIGEAIARAFAREGAKVVVASRKIEGLEPVATAIREAGGDCEAVACHTGKPDEVDALVDRAVARFGRVDVLVNNAATNPYFGPMLDLEQRAWHKTFEVNVEGYFSASRAVARHLLGRKATGSIVNLTSVLGAMAAPFQGIYGMTKAAVISMTRTMALELGPDGIRVNAIAPGLIETRFSRAMTENEAIASMVLQRTALKRIGKPDDVAGAAVFLASDESAYVTGEVLTVDGGWAMT